MSSPSKTRKFQMRAAVGLVLLSGVASAAPQLAEPPRNEREARETIVGTLHAQREAGHGVDRELLEGLLPSVLHSPQVAVEILFDDRVRGATPQAEPTPLNIYQRELLLEALAAADPARVRPWIPEAERLRAGGDRALATCIALRAWTQPPSEAGRLLVESRPPREPDGTRPLRSSGLRKELRSALAHVIGRDPRAAGRSLLDELADASEGDVSSVLRALGDAGQPATIETLLSALDIDGVDARLVVEAVAGIGSSFDPEVDRRLVERLCDHLRSPDELLASAAARAIQSVDAPWAADVLVERLWWAEAAAGPIHDALRSLSGARLGPDARAWSELLQAEREWGEGPMLDTLARVESATPGELIALLRPLGNHRLQRHTIASALSARLGDGYRPVRKAVASVLAQLKSPVSIEALLTALEDDPGEPALIGALVQITGRAFGDDAAAWREWLDSGRS
jgi:HEAT repeat protein